MTFYDRADRRLAVGFGGARIAVERKILSNTRKSSPSAALKEIHIRSPVFLNNGMRLARALFAQSSPKISIKCPVQKKISASAHELHSIPRLRYFVDFIVRFELTKGNR